MQAVPAIQQRETVIDLIRHGLPLGGNRYRGHGIDDPLSDTGWEQMWRSVGPVAPWDCIVSSPMTRCLEFARALGERDGLPVEVEDRLKEVGFGSWEGRSRAQLKAGSREEYEAFYRDPVNNRPAGAEDLAAFIQRVTGAYGEILQRHAGRRVLIVSHAGVIRAIIAHNVRAEPLGIYRIQIGNAGISRLCHGVYGARLQFLNRVPDTTEGCGGR